VLVHDARANIRNFRPLGEPVDHERIQRVIVRPHGGLPWTGCTVLTASADQLGEIYNRALAHDEMFVADMPNSAQTNRVYDEYLAELADTAPADIRPLAISIVGPRNAVDRLVKRLSLL